VSILRFPHRRNQDGTYDSICSSCFMTIATREVEAELAQDEAAHSCNGEASLGLRSFDREPLILDSLLRRRKM
jgi:hypothetical protein